MSELSRLRHRIMKERGVHFSPRQRKLVTQDELPPSIPIKKTAAMRLIEMKFNEPIEKIIFDGSIYTIAKRTGVDPTTISKWRKIVNAALEKIWWEKNFSPKEKSK